MLLSRYAANRRAAALLAFSLDTIVLADACATAVLLLAPSAVVKVFFLLRWHVVKFTLVLLFSTCSGR